MIYKKDSLFKEFLSPRLSSKLGQIGMMENHLGFVDLRGNIFTTPPWSSGSGSCRSCYNDTGENGVYLISQAREFLERVFDLRIVSMPNRLKINGSFHYVVSIYMKQRRGGWRHLKTCRNSTVEINCIKFAINEAIKIVSKRLGRPKMIADTQSSKITKALDMLDEQNYHASMHRKSDHHPAKRIEKIVCTPSQSTFEAAYFKRGNKMVLKAKYKGTGLPLTKPLSKKEWTPKVDKALKKATDKYKGKANTKKVRENIKRDAAKALNKLIFTPSPK